MNVSPSETSESSESSEPEDQSDIQSDIHSDSNSSTTNDVPIEDSELKDRLYEYLSDVKSEGSFSSFQHASLFPNPGLYIKKLGRVIPLPLSDEDAKSIAASSTLAPFGMKEQTVVDTTVRNTWEMNASDFEFRNPAWQPFFKQITKKAVEELGADVDAAVEAQSYKLLLYEEGAFFKAHKDSEKVPGMFASLIVCLPSCSEHAGGDVNLTHGSEKRVLSTSKTSGYDLTALAWYSDVKHEIRPITSGYRLVLTFNLVADSRKAISANILNERRVHLQSLLQVWREDFTYIHKLAYILEHQYTASSLCARNMKGKDRAVSKYLENICQANRFHLFFAQIQKTVEDEDDDEEGTSLDHIVLPNGLIVASKGDIEIDEIIQDKPFDRDADSEEDGEWTGNENMPGRLRYHNTVAIIIPEEKLFDFFRYHIKSKSAGSKNLLEYICKLADDSPDGHNLNELAVRVALKALENDQSGYSSYYSSYNSYLYKQEQCEFYTTAVNLSEKLHDLNLFQTAVVSGISGKGPGADTIFGILAESFNRKCDQHCPDWAKHLGPVVSAVKALPELQSALSRFKLRLAKEQDRTSFEEWANTAIDQRLCSQDTLDHPYHLPMIIELIESRSSQWVSTVMLPILTKIGSQTLVRKLLASLFDKRETDLVKNTVIEIYRHLMGECTLNLSSSLADVWTYSGARRFDRTDVEEFFNLVTNGLTFGLKDEAIRVIEKSSNDLCEGSKHEFTHDDVIYIVTTFMTFATNNPECMSDALAARLFTRLLERAVDEFVRSKPLQSRNWSQKKKGCGSCKDCKEFDQFLCDPVETTHRFHTNMAQRKHLIALAGRWFIVDIDKRKSPHVLVLTKTNQEYEHDIKTWTEQLHDMVTAWKDIQTPYMRRVLEPEIYAELVELRSLRKRENFPPAPPQPTAAELPMKTITSHDLNTRQPRLNAGVKRKADTELEQARGTRRKVEVIELDSD